MRKPHARSRLKTLPPEQQKALFEHLAVNAARITEAWLATGALTGEPLDTNETSLGQFFAWYPQASRLRGVANLTDTVKEVLRDTPTLNLDEEVLSKAGQAIFEKIAIETEDSELYTALRRLRQADSALKLKSKHDTAKLAQKDRALKLELEKFQAALRTKIEQGLEALKVELQDNARAETIFAELQKALTPAA